MFCPTCGTALAGGVCSKCGASAAAKVTGSTHDFVAGTAPSYGVGALDQKPVDPATVAVVNAPPEMISTQEDGMVGDGTVSGASKTQCLLASWDTRKANTGACCYTDNNNPDNCVNVEITASYAYCFPCGNLARPIGQIFCCAAAPFLASAWLAMVVVNSPANKRYR